MGSTTASRGRQALYVVNNNKQDVVASDVAMTDASECGIVDFTKDDVEALLNVKIQGTRFDFKVPILSFTSSSICISPVIRISYFLTIGN